jgi:aminoglycoside/choline kinase family phosphotransferase
LLISCVDELNDLPVVLVHDDFGSLNILSDDDGNVTAVVDWSDARYLPFGWNLYGIAEFYGYMRVDGWVDRPERKELEGVFWAAFWEKAPDWMKAKKDSIQGAISIAKGIGLLWRNVGPNGPEGMMKSYPEGLMFLDALL